MQNHSSEKEDSRMGEVPKLRLRVRRFTWTVLLSGTGEMTRECVCVERCGSGFFWRAKVIGSARQEIYGGVKYGELVIASEDTLSSTELEAFDCAG